METPVEGSTRLEAYGGDVATTSVRDIMLLGSLSVMLVDNCLHPVRSLDDTEKPWEIMVDF